MALGLSIGCSMVTGSMPIDAPKDSWNPYEPWRIDLHGAELRVQFLNLKEYLFLYIPYPTWFPFIRRRPLEIWIHLDPEGGPLRFDPGRVRLEVDGATALEPIGYRGPESADPGSLSVRQWWCLPEALPGIRLSKEIRNSLKKPAGGVELAGMRCLVVAFDTSPSPKHRFTLFVDGLERNGTNVAVPPIRFKRGIH